MTRALALLLALAAAPGAARADDFFEAKIRPVLVAQCYKCHSAASKSLKGGLRVDGRTHLLTGGESGAALVPKDATKGTLLEALRYQNTDLLMPPSGKLPDAVVADFEAWVKAGAPWPDEAAAVAGVAPKLAAFDLSARKAAHWCWQPLARPAVPTVADASWPRDPIDRFLLAKLEAAKLTPAPAADPATWLRRATFALTGLPPTPAELDKYLKSPDSAAAIDRLLASPRYGERWGRHWLDLVRYAESRGHEFDPDIPNAYQYRDYVVRAFNADVPYDAFVREHLAGDTDTSPRRDPATGANESAVGTAFWHLGEEVHSPVDIRQDEADRFDNRIDVFSKAFLGLTVSCARCHDHKFDAISAKDYAALYGVLEGSSFRQVRFDTMEQHRDLAKRFAAKADEFAKRPAPSPPPLPEPTGDFARVSSGASHRSPDPAKDIALAAWLAKQKVVVDYAVTAPTADTADGPAFRHARAGRATYRPTGVRTEPRGALVYDRFWDRLKVTPGSALDGFALSKQPRAGLTVRTPHFTLEAKRVHLLVRGGGLAYAAVSGHTIIAGPLHGALVKSFPDAPAYRWVTLDLAQYVGRRLHVELTATQGTDFAVAMVVQSDDTPPAPSAGLVPDWVSGDPAAAWQAVEAELAKGVEWSSRLVPALWDADGVDEQVFIRGNPRAPGEVVPRRSLEALAGTARVTATPGSGRRELAAQVTDGARNPLFDRVIVNRLWHHLFGRGLVPTTDNFGVLGEAPTHPELLDYLATEFAQSGRRVKPFLKRLMLTRAYAMSSRPTPDERDPTNALLHHFRATRLEGEAIRDAMLQVSGRLDLTKAGGPSTPIALTAFLDGRGRPASGPLDGDGRRSLYLAVRRNFLSPFLLAYDTPIPFSTVGRRQSSNVPAQSLILMNDPFVHAQAALWATRTLAAAGTPEQRVDRMYREAFARSATPAEAKAATDFVAGNDPKAWADLAHALFTVKEFVFVR